MHHLRSYHLAVQFYREAKTVTLPYDLKVQLKRAASSIALNLAEGTGKLSQADQRRFFGIALGSIRECQAIIELEAEVFTNYQRNLIDHLAASTYKLIRHSSL